MTKDEALRLALEALENHCGNYKLDDAGCERWNKAVAVIKEALAQSEQKPVATMKMLHTYGDTTPPQRPWVGLTKGDCKGMSLGDKVTAVWTERLLKEKNT